MLLLLFLLLAESQIRVVWKPSRDRVCLESNTVCIIRMARIKRLTTSEWHTPVTVSNDTCIDMSSDATRALTDALLVVDTDQHSYYVRVPPPPLEEEKEEEEEDLEIEIESAYGIIFILVSLVAILLVLWLRACTQEERAIAIEQVKKPPRLSIVSFPGTITKTEIKTSSVV